MKNKKATRLAVTLSVALIVIVGVGAVLLGAGSGNGANSPDDSAPKITFYEYSGDDSDPKGMILSPNSEGQIVLGSTTVLATKFSDTAVSGGVYYAANGATEPIRLYEFERQEPDAANEQLFHFESAERWSGGFSGYFWTSEKDADGNVKRGDNITVLYELHSPNVLETPIGLFDDLI